MKDLKKITYLAVVFLAILMLHSCSREVELEQETFDNNTSIQSRSVNCTSNNTSFNHSVDPVNCGICWKFENSNVEPADQPWNWCGVVTTGYPLYDPVTTQDGEISSIDEAICIYGLDVGTYEVKMTLFDDDGVCWNTGFVIEAVLECEDIEPCEPQEPCDEVTYDEICLFNWPTSDGEEDDEECTIEILNEEIFQLIENYIGPGIHDPTGVCGGSVIFDISTCDGDDITPIPSAIPDFWPDFTVLLNGQPIAQDGLVGALSVPCCAVVSIDITITGCDDFMITCNTTASCGPEECEGCGDCGLSEYIFTDLKLRDQEVNILTDFKMNFCDGTAPIEYGDDAVIIRNESVDEHQEGDPCDPEDIKWVAANLFDINGYYWKLNQLSSDINEELQSIPGCAGAYFDMSKETVNEGFKSEDEFVKLTLAYNECSDCPVSSISYHAVGLGLYHDNCGLLSCASYCVDKKWEPDCGYCHK